MGFRFSYGAGLLKNDVVYKYHYFNRNVFRDGDVVLDIGGNLGYYTTLFSGWVGKSGHVYAVEPVDIYFKTLKWATRNCPNVTLYNNALGNEEKEIILSTPGGLGYLRTGVTHVASQAEAADSSNYNFKAQMVRGSKLFGGLQRIDFIKCDVEGYEEYILAEMKDILVKHKPVIQLETYGDQQVRIEALLTGMGYEIYDIENGKVILRDNRSVVQYGDLYFIHKDNKAILERLKQKGLA